MSAKRDTKKLPLHLSGVLSGGLKKSPRQLGITPKREPRWAIFSFSPYGADTYVAKKTIKRRYLF